jgi:uncharacterized membrane protein (UPF0127 family)
MTFFKKIFICATLFIASLSYSKERTCTVKFLCVPKALAAIEIADTDALRATGLMNRYSLGENEGMLFIFEENDMRSFWMRNTYIPLSIAYIGKNMVINEIYDMKPLDTSIIYYSKKPAMYALEMRQGWFRRNKIAVGCKIEIVK